MIRMPSYLAHPRHLGAMVLALALAGAGAGCYTLVRHPQAAEPVDAHSDDICYSCHSSSDGLDLDLYPWADYYSHSSSPWINYYAAPWWYDSRWERSAPPAGGAASGTAERPQSDRAGWGRHARSSSLSDSLRRRDATFSPAPIVSSPPAAPLSPGTPAQGSTSGTSGNNPSDEQKKKEVKEPQRRTLRR
jgi:hypothetical protein